MISETTTGEVLDILHVCMYVHLGYIYDCVHPKYIIEEGIL